MFYKIRNEFLNLIDRISIIFLILKTKILHFITEIKIILLEIKFSLWKIIHYIKNPIYAIWKLFKIRV